MKSLFVATFVLVLTLAAVAQTQHLKFTQDAEFANLSQTTGPNSSFQLQVARSNATNSASLEYLEFDFAPDFTSLTFVQIVGAIPSGAFTGQTTHDMVLSFDTSQLDPNTSVSQSCTFDFTTLITTCGPAPTGLLSVEWRENDVVRSKVALIEDDTVGAVTTTLHQHSDNASAGASGTVFGVVVAPSSAQVGVNHASTMEVTRN